MRGKGPPPQHHLTGVGDSSMDWQKEKSANSVGSTAITRRHFLKVTGAIILVTATGGCKLFKADESPTLVATQTPMPTAAQTPVPTATQTPGTGQILVPADEIPPADGYLLVDIGKCQGCASCMLACSLIHEGVESLSLSRIQIMQNPFASFPGDLTVEPCRQCVDPACVKVCPTGALKADAKYGNVRMVDKEECIGCGSCVEACPFEVSRINFDQEMNKAIKCDLCKDRRGGPACVETCLMGALTLERRA